MVQATDQISDQTNNRQQPQNESNSRICVTTYLQLTNTVCDYRSVSLKVVAQ